MTDRPALSAPADPPPSSCLFLLVACALPVACGALLLWVDRSLRADVHAQWSTTSGNILRVRVEPEMIGPGDAQKLVYVPHVEYRYQVTGKDYASSHFTDGDVYGNDTPEAAAQQIARYCENLSAQAVYANSGNRLSGAAGILGAAQVYVPSPQPVTVHYDPKNPKRAVLEPARSTPTRAFYWIGCSLIALGGIVLLLTPLSPKPPDRRHPELDSPSRGRMYR